MDVVVDILERSTRGVREVADRLIQENYGAGKKVLNLLAHEHSCTSAQDITKYWDAEAVFYKASSRTSMFNVVCDGRHAIRLSVTLRIPKETKISGSNLLALEVNSSVVLSCSASTSWETHSIDVTGGILQLGVNCIRIVWPEQSWTRQERMQQLVAHLKRSRIPRTSPTYGEIYALEASFTSNDTLRPT